MWQLITYAEHVSNEYINHTIKLSHSFEESISLIWHLFSKENFQIVLRNYSDKLEDNDFILIRLEDNQQIGEIEYDN